MSNQYFFPNGTSYTTTTETESSQPSASSRTNKKHNPHKPMENPLLKSPVSTRTVTTRQKQQHFFEPADSSNNNNTPSSLYQQQENGGLRQRKSSSTIPAGLPPKASFSLGTTSIDPPEETAAAAATGNGSHEDSRMTMHTPLLEDDVPSAAALGCWVLVYGYSINNHGTVDDLLRRFGARGEIVESRSLGQNGMALKYASPLQAAKVACLQVVVQDGVYCGVKALDDRDPVLFENRKTQNHAWWTSDEVQEEEKGANSGEPLLLLAGGGSRSRNGHDNNDANGHAAWKNDEANNDVLHESDILLVKGSRPARKQKASMCERLLRWVLSIPDD